MITNDSRIALIAPIFPKLSETFIANKFYALLENGWDVHIICQASHPAEWGNYPELQAIPDIRRRVHIVWRHEPRWLALLLLPLALLRCLAQAPRATWRYLRRGWQSFGADILRRLYLDAEIVILQPDLLHFEFGTLATDRMYLKDLLNCKIIVSFRGYDLNYIGLEQPNYYQEVWEKASSLHLLGNDLWLRAQRRGCPPNKPHILIPPAIDTQFFTPSQAAEEACSVHPLRILSVARLEWKKGYEYALQAVRILLDRGIECEYHIVGDGDYSEAVAFARRQLGLGDAVHLLGAQPRHFVKGQMEWADVFLHPAVSEGFCNAVLEAQAMQLAVVCSDADGLPENVQDGKTGFVVSRRDPQALAEKLACLARNPTLRQQMGKAGRERVQQHFRLETQVQAFEHFYNKVLSSQPTAEKLL